MTRPDCKYPSIDCEFNYADEFGDPLNKCHHEGGCIFKVYPDENEEWGLQKALTHSPFWTLWGCDSKKKVVVDETIIMAIKAWAGDSTEPNSGLYKNPEAMFSALDLIYCLLDEAQEGPVKVSKDKPYSAAPGTWEISQIVSINPNEVRRTIE